jgi:predicted metal-dependent peptidase
MTKLTQQERVTKAHISIMRSQQFCMFSGVLSIGDVKFTDQIPTAATNGRDVYYNPDFIATMDDKELTFVVLHEALHKVFQHMHLWRKLWKEDPMLANMAADYIVNGTIVQADPHSAVTTMPDMALHDTKYYGMTTRQVFDLLKQQGQGKGKGKGQGQGNGETLDHHDWDGAGELTEQEVKEVQKQIDQALRQGEIIRGKMSGNRSRAVEELLEPKIDWREQMRDFVTSVCKNKDKSSWRRPSRRFIGQNIYMPSLIGEAVGKLVIAIDTSGSIGQQELTEFLTEVKSICDEVSPEAVELLYWDSSVAAHETYRQGDYEAMISMTKPAGGGGTTVGCVNQYIKDKLLSPEAVVILTDGYVESDWGGSWTHPTLWAITTRGVTSPHGKSLYLGE